MQLCGSLNILWHCPSLILEWKLTCSNFSGPCWFFQTCWHIECSALTASSFRILNSSAGIPSLSLSLFILTVMIPSESCSVVSNSLQPRGLYSPWDSPGQNTGVGSLSLLWGIFPTQGLKAGFLHCRWIFLSAEPQGSPRILEWVAYPFSGQLSQPRNQTRVSCIAGGFFTSWATREAL